MIIQVRGTSGSGKTWVMKQVMEHYGQWVPKYEPGRKKPLYYQRGGMIVLGHYEAACGGCDSIGSAGAVAELIEKVSIAEFPTVILCEGLLLSEDTKWSRDLEDLHILFLTTPVETCLKQIMSRREEKGVENRKPLNTANTTNRANVIERARKKLIELNIECTRAPAEQAPGIVVKWVSKKWSKDDV